MASKKEPSAEQVELRSLEAQDVVRTHRWHNDPALYQHLTGSFRHVSLSAEEDWLDRRIAYSTSEVNLAICVRDSGKHIGNIYLRDIDPNARHASLEIFLGDSSHRGQGFGSSAVRQLIRHAFEDLNLHRLWLHLLATNEAALRLYRSCGFEIEGTLRRHAIKGGKPVDVFIMGLLRYD
jgi:RimJ/RimL family protein N-acetyltransferase